MLFGEPLGEVKADLAGSDDQNPHVRWGGEPWGVSTLPTFVLKTPTRMAGAVGER